MLIHFSKMQFVLHETEEAKSEALRTIHMLISRIYDCNQKRNWGKNYNLAVKRIGSVMLKIIKEKNLSNQELRQFFAKADYERINETLLSIEPYYEKKSKSYRWLGIRISSQLTHCEYKKVKQDEYYLLE